MVINMMTLARGAITIMVPATYLFTIIIVLVNYLYTHQYQLLWFTLSRQTYCSVARFDRVTKQPWYMHDWRCLPPAGRPAKYANFKLSTHRSWKPTPRVFASLSSATSVMYYFSHYSEVPVEWSKWIGFKRVRRSPTRLRSHPRTLARRTDLELNSWWMRVERG